MAAASMQWDQGHGMSCRLFFISSESSGEPAFPIPTPISWHGPLGCSAVVASLLLEPGRIERFQRLHVTLLLLFAEAPFHLGCPQRQKAQAAGSLQAQLQCVLQPDIRWAKETCIHGPKGIMRMVACPQEPAAPFPPFL